jgi:hypothetical protein
VRAAKRILEARSFFMVSEKTGVANTMPERLIIRIAFCKKNFRENYNLIGAKSAEDNLAVSIRRMSRSFHAVASLHGRSLRRRKKIPLTCC